MSDRNEDPAAACARRTAIGARSAAVQAELDALGLPGCRVTIGLNGVGAETRSARVDTQAIGFSDAQWADLGAFLHAHDITSLDVSFAPVTDLDFLSYLPWLTALNFGGQITNADGLGALSPDLVHLGWGADRKLSLSALERFPRLRTLGVGRGKDFEVLSRLTELRHLSLGNTGLATLDVITGLPELRWVSLGEGKPPNLSALATLPQLSILHIERWRALTDEYLAPLADCVRLRLIELDGLPQVTALPDLSLLTGLTAVWLNNLQSLTTLAGAAAAPQLKYLWFEGKNVTPDLFTDFADHPSLAYVIVAKPRRKDLSDVLSDRCDFVSSNAYIDYRLQLYADLGLIAALGQ